jgi:predicted transcriptional regulator
MGYTTVRISTEAHQKLRDLAEKAGRPMQSLLEDAVETLRRQTFLERLNEDYASLRADPAEWRRVEAEREAWDVTLGDGLTVAEPRSKYRTTKKQKTRR